MTRILKKFYRIFLPYKPAKKYHRFCSSQAYRQHLHISHVFQIQKINKFTQHVTSIQNLKYFHYQRFQFTEADFMKYVTTRLAISSKMDLGYKILVFSSSSGSFTNLPLFPHKCFPRCIKYLFCNGDLLTDSRS